MDQVKFYFVSHTVLQYFHIFFIYKESVVNWYSQIITLNVKFACFLVLEIMMIGYYWLSTDYIFYPISKLREHIWHNNIFL